MYAELSQYDRSSVTRVVLAALGGVAARISTLTSQYKVAFLKTALVGETAYEEMRTTGYALENEPFIEFFETEKGTPSPRDEEAYFSYFMHQPGALQAKALKDPSP